MKLVHDLEAECGRGTNAITAEMETELVSLSFATTGLSERHNLAVIEHPGGLVEQISAKRVVIGATGQDVGNIKGLGDCVSPARWAAVKNSKSMPLFKAFMEFPKGPKGAWWREFTSADGGGGLQHGKSTTDLRCRQIHYYDEEDLLIYNSDGDLEEEKYASQWDKAFKADIAAGRKQGEEGSAMREMWEMVREVHASQGIPKEEIPEPLWDKCIYKYWSSGSHKWKKHCDVHAMIELIADGTSDESGVYIVGDAFSDMQGWVEGAINTCEIAYRKFHQGVEVKNKGSVRMAVQAGPGVNQT